MSQEDPAVVAKAQYRASLVQLQEKMQAEYDKTVLALSGGAFGVSVLLIKELIGAKKAVGSASVTMAWIFWGVSVLAVLCSFFSSAKAMEAAITRIDRDEPISEDIGGTPDLWTRGFNYASGGCFVVGLGFFIYFVYVHL